MGELSPTQAHSRPAWFWIERVLNWLVIGLADLGFYYLIPLFPFVALGMAALIRYGFPLVAQTTREGLKSLFQSWQWSPARPAGQWLRARVLALSVSVALFLVVLSPFLIVTFLGVGQAQNGFHTALGPVLVNPRDACQVAEFINGQVRPDDLVIASPALTWLLRAHGRLSTGSCGDRQSDPALAL